MITLTAEQINSIIETYNISVDAAQTALEWMDKSAGKAYDRNNSRHSYHTGKLAGIDATLEAAGYMLIVDDEDHAVDIVAIDEQ